MAAHPPAALITGASTGIGATYADRLARRGYDLVLVARDRARLNDLAGRLRADTKRRIDVVQADLTSAADLRRVERQLAEDDRIELLINNAGAALQGGIVGADLDQQENLIQLNIVAMTRLAGAVIPRFLARGNGSMVNLAWFVERAPEMPLGIYGATKAYALSFSQSLQAELGPRGIYVQAVMPGATRTEIWQRSGRDVNTLRAVMDVGEMVDAALVGFDRKEPVTFPALQDEAVWQAFVAARQAMLPNLQKSDVAARYRA